MITTYFSVSFHRVHYICRTLAVNTRKRLLSVNYVCVKEGTGTDITKPRLCLPQGCGKRKRTVTGCVQYICTVITLLNISPITRSLHSLPLRPATATIKSHALYTASGSSLTRARHPGIMFSANLSIIKLSKVSTPSASLGLVWSFSTLSSDLGCPVVEDDG